MTKIKALLFLLTLALPMTAQQQKLFTLEDLNFGGTNYHAMQPKNMWLTWWGDQLVQTDVEECYTIDTKTGTIYLKFVNAEAKDKQITVSLNTADAYTAEMEYITSHDTSVKNQGDQNYYSSHPDVPADFSYREAITPQTKSLGTVQSSFTFTMPENSVGVLRLKK